MMSADRLDVQHRVERGVAEVEVDERHRVPAQRERGGEVRGHRGLALPLSGARHEQLLGAGGRHGEIDARPQGTEGVGGLRLTVHRHHEALARPLVATELGDLAEEPEIHLPFEVLDPPEPAVQRLDGEREQDAEQEPEYDAEHDVAERLGLDLAVFRHVDDRALGRGERLEDLQALALLGERLGERVAGIGRVDLRVEVLDRLLIAARLARATVREVGPRVRLGEPGRVGLIARGGAEHEKAGPLVDGHVGVRLELAEGERLAEPVRGFASDGAGFGDGDLTIEQLGELVRVEVRRDAAHGVGDRLAVERDVDVASILDVLAQGEQQREQRDDDRGLEHDQLAPSEDAQQVQHRRISITQRDTSWTYRTERRPR
jgi:hypothetical protein